MPRWGPDGPPPEAYSRVTRDLAVVYADLHRLADERVARLLEQYDATSRVLTEAEQQRLAHPARSVAVDPADPAAAVLLVGWIEGPALRTFAGGWGSGAVTPTCSCDACDTSLPEALDELDRVIHGVVGAAHRSPSTQRGRQRCL